MNDPISRARALLSAGGVMNAFPWRLDPRDPRSILRADGDRVAVLEGPAWDTDGPLLAAAPDLASLLIALHTRAEAAEGERDELRAVFDAENSYSRKPCGDNSCVLEDARGGMRTNGGCRCPAGLLRMRYRGMRAERDALRTERDAYCEYHEAREAQWALAEDCGGAEHFAARDRVTAALARIAALREAAK